MQAIYDMQFLHHIEVYVRILVSALLGMLLGYDRTAKNKPAGLKTFTFVTVSTTLITIISIFSAEVYGGSNFNNRVDPMRLAAQIVSGLGFLGAGLILKDRGKITGLTSAAMIFFAGGVGIGVGAGFYGIVIFSVLVTFIASTIGNYIERKEDMRSEMMVKKKE